MNARSRGTLENSISMGSPFIANWDWHHHNLDCNDQYETPRVTGKCGRLLYLLSSNVAAIDIPCRKLPNRGATICIPSSASRFEFEIRQIHVSIGQDVDCENILSLSKRNLEKLRSQVPMVPLTPGDWVCGVKSCGHLQRSRCVFAIHVD